MTPILDDILHAKRVKGYVLPLQYDNGFVGEGVHAEYKNGLIVVKVVADAPGLVIGLPCKQGEVIRTAND